MTRVRLLQGLAGVSQWKSFGNDDLDFLSIDQSSDLGQLVAILFSLQGHAPNPIFIQLRLVNAANQAHQSSTFFYDGIGSLQCFATDAINNYVNFFGDILEFLRLVIDGHIGSKLFQEILIGSRSSREHFRTANLCNWNREDSNSARCSLDQYRLPRLNICFVNERLPRGECD